MTTSESHPPRLKIGKHLLPLELCRWIEDGIWVPELNLSDEWRRIYTETGLFRMMARADADATAFSFLPPDAMCECLVQLTEIVQTNTFGSRMAYRMVSSKSSESALVSELLSLFTRATGWGQDLPFVDIDSAVPIMGAGFHEKWFMLDYRTTIPRVVGPGRNGYRLYFNSIQDFGRHLGLM
ncbi:MAG: hypothetical protein AAFV53_36860 [Myxococcota bacterium]